MKRLLISKKSLGVIIALVAMILLIPLVAMQFTDEVNWGIADFVVAGVLLFSCGYGFRALTQNNDQLAKKIMVGIAILAVLLAIWVSLI